MKKICISFAMITIIILSLAGVTIEKTAYKTEYLRIHVRANSNLIEEQQVKYKVKDAVVEYLTPFIAECNTKQKAQKMLLDNLSQIETVANNVLTSNGFNYKAKASVRREEFPTRVYENVTLSAGVYEALILELGSGLGDNWWCVVYPPLCFTGEGAGYVYKSKILQIINRFFNKEN